MKVFNFSNLLIISDLRQNSKFSSFKTFIFIKKWYFYKVISNIKIIYHKLVKSAGANMKNRKTVTAPLKWTTAMKLLAIMREADDLAETRLLFALGFYTGLRISDILKLRWQDVENPVLIIEEQKTGKTRRIDLNKKLQVIIQQVRAVIQPLEDNQFIFKGKRGPNKNKSLTVVGANNRIKQVFERFDIQTQNPSSHTLRKTFALRVYNVNQRSEDALILLSEMFNHSNISITRKYIGITQERIKNVYLSI
mgnify:FL=1